MDINIKAANQQHHANMPRERGANNHQPVNLGTEYGAMTKQFNKRRQTVDLRVNVNAANTITMNANNGLVSGSPFNNTNRQTHSNVQSKL